jgi:antitoxin HigA-1
MTSRSSITTDENRTGEFLELATPGELLLEEFLTPMKLSQYRLAHDIGVPPRRINEIVHGKRAISADTALRLGRYFAMSPRFWMNLQADYDLRLAERRSGELIARTVVVRASA